MLEDGHCLRDQAMGFCFQAGAREDTHFRATSMETLRNMVAAGSGITLLPDLAIPPEHKRDGVCYLSCTNPEPFREVILVYRPVAAAQPLQPAGRGYPCKNVCLLPAGACGLK